MKTGTPKKNGLTMMEIMIVIMLMAICLTVITRIIYDYSRVLKQSQEKENELFGIQMGLHRIAAELREANEVIIPENIGDTDNIIEFKRRDQPYLPTDSTWT